MDRRVRRTRDLLRRALLDLILEKGYDRITVQEVIDRADVGRSTFYAHFTDKDDLLLSGLEEMSATLEEQMRRHLEGGDPNPVLAAFRHADQHRRLWKALAGRRGAEVMRDGVRRRIYDIGLRQLHSVLPEGGPPHEVTFEFLMSSLVGLLTWWIDEDRPYTPEQMADMYMRLAVSSVHGAHDVSGQFWKSVQ